MNQEKGAAGGSSEGAEATGGEKDIVVAGDDGVAGDDEFAGGDGDDHGTVTGGD